MSIVSVLTRKSIADVTRRKGRTVLMILGILIGVLGLTAVNVANDAFGREFFSIVAPTDVPNITFSVNALPASVAETLKHASNVETVQVRTQLFSTWLLAQHAGAASLEINSYQDWHNIQLSGSFQLTSGRLPGRGEVMMASRDRFVQPITLGDRITVQALNGQIVSLRIVGLAYTIEQTPARAIAYMSTDGLQAIAQMPVGNSLHQGQNGPPPLSTEVMIKTHDRSYNGVQQTSDALTQVLKAAHIAILDSHSLSTTGQQDTQLAITGLFNILLILTMIALLLVSVMILNTVTILLTEQMKVIGTMKVIGGTSSQIMRSYLVSISIYALVGTALGLGSGLLLCVEVATIVSEQTQMDLPPFQISPWVILTSLAVGLLVPLLSALLPLWRGTHITIREAMAAYGVSAGNAKRATAWGHQVHWIPQTVWLGVRGVFRKPGRAMLTLLALALSSAAFMAVQITNESIGAAVYHDRNLYSYDMWVALAQNPLLAQRMRTAIQSLPNVERVGPPVARTFVMTTKGELEIDGLPASPQVYQPRLVAGRWLRGQERGVLVLSDIAAQRLHVQVGENLTFSLETRRVQQGSWQIVGIVHELTNASASAATNVRLGMSFTTLDNLQTLPNVATGDAPGIWLYVHDRSPQALQQLRSQVVSIFNQMGLQPDLSTPVLDEMTEPNPMLIIYALFDTVAILVALVGLLSLSNTLSASVLERRLEISILRSLGATGWRVGVVFWVEGLSLALIAWGIGTLLGPLGGTAILNRLSTFAQPFDTVFNPIVILITLLFVIIVSGISSFGPALSASRVRIRETLRYE